MGTCLDCLFLIFLYYTVPPEPGSELAALISIGLLSKQCRRTIQDVLAEIHLHCEHALLQVIAYKHPFERDGMYELAVMRQTLRAVIGK